MKKILLALLFIPSVALAADVSSRSSEISRNVPTMSVVSVTTTTAIQMDSTPLTGRVVVEVHNADSASNLWCAFTQAGAVVSNSRKISAGAAWILGLPATTATGATDSVWCIADGAYTVKGILTQM